MSIMLIIIDASLIRVQYKIIVCRLLIGQVLTICPPIKHDCINPITVPILILGYDNGMHAQASIRFGDIPVSVCC